MPDGFVLVNNVRNLLRDRGYKFRGPSKSQRTNLWTHPTTQHAVNLPNTDQMAIAEARIILGFAGMTPDEIERFFGHCRS